MELYNGSDGTEQLWLPLKRWWGVAHSFDSPHMADMHLADTLVFCVTFLNYLVSENGNAINQCNFQDDYCAIA